MLKVGLCRERGPDRLGRAVPGLVARGLVLLGRAVPGRVARGLVLLGRAVPGRVRRGLVVPGPKAARRLSAVGRRFLWRVRRRFNNWRFNNWAQNENIFRSVDLEHSNEVHAAFMWRDLILPS